MPSCHEGCYRHVRCLVPFNPLLASKTTAVPQTLPNTSTGKQPQLDVSKPRTAETARPALHIDVEAANATANLKRRVDSAELSMSFAVSSQRRKFARKGEKATKKRHAVIFASPRLCADGSIETVEIKATRTQLFTSAAMKADAAHEFAHIAQQMLSTQIGEES